jgi:hypothetical protein
VLALNRDQAAGELCVSAERRGLARLVTSVVRIAESYAAGKDARQVEMVR